MSQDESFSLRTYSSAAVLSALARSTSCSDWSRELRHYPQLDPIVGGMNQILLSSQVALSCLDRRMAEQQLDLFQFSAGRPAEFRCRAAEVIEARFRQLRQPLRKAVATAR